MENSRRQATLHAEPLAPRPRFRRSPGGNRQVTSLMLDRALSEIVPLLPTSDEAVRASLSTIGLEGWDLRWVEQAARFFRRPLPFTVVRHQGRAIALRADSLALVIRAREEALRAVARQGLACLRSLSHSNGSDRQLLGTPLVQEWAGLRPLDEGREWIWCGERASAVTRTIGKKLRAEPRVSYVDARALLLDHARPGFEPPGPVIRALLGEILRAGEPA